MALIVIIDAVMNLKLLYIKYLFSLVILIYTAPTFAQLDTLSKIYNSEFPDSWDSNRELRNRNGKILCWKHIKSGTSSEIKSCIVIVSGPDSTGNMEYYISEKYSNKKPFNKWHWGFIYYADYAIDSATGMKFGFRDLHLKKYNHKPTEDELYGLFRKWEYAFFEEGSQTIEAGLDEKLWLDIFGFIPRRDKLTRIE